MDKKLVEMFKDLDERGLVGEPLELRVNRNFTYREVPTFNSANTVAHKYGLEQPIEEENTDAQLDTSFDGNSK